MKAYQELSKEELLNLKDELERAFDIVKEKGLKPHILSTSATPIPRSLSLILYGDMDLSVINELPAERLPIKNCVVDTSYRPTAFNFIRKEIIL